MLVQLFGYMLAILPTAFSVWFVFVFAVMVFILGVRIYQFVKACLPFNG